MAEVLTSCEVEIAEPHTRSVARADAKAERNDMKRFCSITARVKIHPFSKHSPQMKAHSPRLGAVH